jgi:geranylgeranyl reductase family protein
VERADVLVVGGGPAGSSCAARLAAAGVDVVVMDRAVFPRDKPCAGWITPEVVRALSLDLDGYGASHTLQPVTSFRVGWVGDGSRLVRYDEPVSWGIRRCELDGYLLRRSGARLRESEEVASIERDGDGFVVNDTLTCRFLVGAGGHFCPVARMLGRNDGGRSVVVAQEAEVRMSADAAGRCAVEPGCPELHFTRDLDGYGWCFRKDDVLNVGLGLRRPGSLVPAIRGYLAFLGAKGRVPSDVPLPLRGHAYRLREGVQPRPGAEGILLAGDAAGLAHAASGEGILPAVLSGQLAAEVLLTCLRDGSRDPLPAYEAGLDDRLGPLPRPVPLPGPLRLLAGRAVLASAWLTRRVVLDEWFLHRGR